MIAAPFGSHLSRPRGDVLSMKYLLASAAVLAVAGSACAQTISLKPVAEGRLRYEHADQEGLPEENLQSRLRGNILMSLANKNNAIVLTTGNKSEMATGYATLYGDLAGGFAVIKDVPKTLVYKLAKWRNLEDSNSLIPDEVISKPPSAELRPEQLDTDSLPEYEVLDPILEAYVERDATVDELIKAGFQEEDVRHVINLIDRNEYKRRQSPPGVKITQRAFGRDRRLPLAQRYNP